MGMNVKKFKVLDLIDPLFRDFNLTSFVTVKNKLKNSYPRYLLLSSFLNDYGIYISGQTNIRFLDGEKSDTIVYSLLLDKDFPIENFGIIVQLYGYKNSLVNVALSRNDEREYAFDFNTKDFSCTLKRYEWGSIKFNKKYLSFEEMMVEIRSKKSIDELI